MTGYPESKEPKYPDIMGTVRRVASSDSDASALLPCPFCGCDAEIDTRRVYRDIHTGRLGDAVAIYCTNDDGCPADMGICREVAQDGTTEQVVAELTELWNRRVR
jgi:hypothetical protein